jgi:hypothetical protein
MFQSRTNITAYVLKTSFICLRYSLIHLKFYSFFYFSYKHDIICNINESNLIYSFYRIRIFYIAIIL